MHIYINKNKLFIDHYKIKCSIGKRGIKIKKKEGDKITPKGNFKIKHIFYRKDRVPTLITKINKTPINKNMGWCDDPKSKYYNKLVKFPFKYSAENLFRKDNIYDIILVLNFNTNPVLIGKGSAIFIHIAKKNYNKTEGCIAVSKQNMKKIIKKVNKKTLVKIN
tara:strand:+ start:1725 stop:2216 length:492 start_codon:yes stop_codon:yes gene_type:complete